MKNGVPAPAAAPAPAPEPEPAPGPEPEEDAPWYTDDDAPPEGDFIPAPPPISEPEPTPVPPAGPEPEPTSAPALSADSDSVWQALLQSLNGKLDMGVYAMLMTPSQVTGSMAGDVMTILFATPIAKMMLGTPANQSLFQAELRSITGREVHVSFADKPAGTPGKADMKKLDALSRFGNIKFE